jgi:hypothetical protein
MNKWLVVGISVVLAGGFAGTSCAQTHTAQKEIDTAHTHAMYAAEAPTVAVSHMHLHHVINCLVGPKGASFDTKQADPCKGQGNGAIPDSITDHALHAKLESVLAEAKTGLKSDSLAAVHSDAAKVAASLQQAGSSATNPGGS